VRALVTGGAGFIGSTLVDRLLGAGHSVVALDDLSTGRERFLQGACANDRFAFVRGDLLTPSCLTDVVHDADVVFHFAANADVRHGLEHPERDLQQNTIGTFKVLEAMRVAGRSRIAFASTGSIYGEPAVFPTPEDAPFPRQTSLYGASKLAGEALIQAYCEGFGFEAWIFRFVSILGERYSHGHVFDFYKRLKADPTELKVLGDGEQRKSYLHVQDCIDAILLAIERSTDRVNIFNLGTDEFCRVKESIAWITADLGLRPALVYAGGSRGWIGDSPFIFLDCRKIRALGWSPTHTIRESVIATLHYLRANPWLLEARA
jgi:UDP-glucose 4-epimerase